jgi:nucleotide-binding universal stress UspA family protein
MFCDVDIVMPSVLVPVDGSDNSMRALQAACRLVAHRQPVTLHLLNVQPPNHSAVVKKYLSQDLIDKFHQEEGETVLRSACAQLDDAGIGYMSHVEVGDVAVTITRCVQKLYCDQIIMGTGGLGARGIAALSGLLLGSTATKVLHLVDVPVTLVK